MGLYSFLISKLQAIKYTAFPPKLLSFSAIYKISYLNYKHDPQPLIWVQYSGPKYTHALNLNYADYSDKQWLARMIQLLRRSNQAMDGLSFYRFIKLNRINLVKKCYRVYFTNQIRNQVLVSAGLTSMDSLVKPYPDAFIRALNESLIENEGMTQPKPQISFSQQELYDKVNQVFASVPLSSQRAVTGVQTKGVAPWFTAPWLRRR